jgi:hypothetical protein
MKEEIVVEQDNSKSVSLQIAQCVAGVKKISERIVGYIKYDYRFVCQTYDATSVRPAKITPLERAIVGILKVDEHQDLISIGNILGFDVVHDTAEKEILNQAVESMRKYEVLEGDDSYLALTEKGSIFASTGERPETYKGSFDLWVDPVHPGFTELKNYLRENAIKDVDEESKAVDFSFDEIKELAEHQASNFQAARLRYVLSEASLKASSQKEYPVYVCFLQSVRDNIVKTLVYDAAQDSLLPPISELIDGDAELKQELLGKCIALECESEDAELLPNATEKTEEQTSAEKKLIEEEDIANKAEEEKSNIGTVAKDGHLHKKALYDSLSFEAELRNIFLNDNADEIWLVSPWVGHAFVHQRLPYIKDFLKEGKKIFIAFSKEEASIKPSSSHGKMVSPEAKDALDELKNKYPTLFFFDQLPAFHTKNVIEKKGDQCVMFTGSFNVLSFSVNEKQTQIRREEMALAHHQVAINKYGEYLKAFTDDYVKEAIDKLKLFEEQDKDEEIIKYDLTSVKALIAMSGREEDFIDFFNEVESRQLLAKNAIWLKEVDALSQSLDPYFQLRAIPNKEKYNFDKRFKNLMRRFVNLTVSSVDKETLDNLYSKFVELPTGNKAKEILKGKYIPGHTHKDERSISNVLELIKKIINSSEVGRRISLQDISAAKKCCGPQNALQTDYDLIKLLVAVNLLLTAIRSNLEKKMQIRDIVNPIARIIKRCGDFSGLSIFRTTNDGKDVLIFDIYGAQFLFEGIRLTEALTATVERMKKNTNKWDGTKSNLHCAELLDVIEK